ncbi:MAG: hypothetical protein AAFY83_12915 [Pseudomonadota bacterium]
MKKIGLFVLVITALLGCAANQRSLADKCAGFSPCIVKNDILILSDGDQAAGWQGAALTARTAFYQYFGKDAAPVAIVPGGQIDETMTQALRAAGYTLHLPWLTDADKQALQIGSIREQIRNQTKDLQQAQQDALIAQALQQAGLSEDRPDPDNSKAQTAEELGALTHELGHLWFIEAFEKEDFAGPVPAKRYGGWAPDWLDETAAILLENDQLTLARRTQFENLATTDLYALSTFLTMEHPSLQATAALEQRFGAQSDDGGSRAIVLTGKEAEEFQRLSAGGDPLLFYLQVRAFTDFILATTADERIFAGLTSFLQQGRSFEDWVADRPEFMSFSDLQSQWDRWVASRLTQ